MTISRTPLWLRRHPEIIRVLVQARADRTVQCKGHFTTPLDYSQQHGYTEIVEILNGLT
jgi:hypothetical protein